MCPRLLLRALPSLRKKESRSISRRTLLASAAILAVAAGFVLKYVFRYYLHYDQPAFEDPVRGAANYWTMRGWLLVHMSGGMLALLTGPWQFWTGFRARRHHRLGVLGATAACNRSNPAASPHVRAARGLIRRLDAANSSAGTPVSAPFPLMGWSCVGGDCLRSLFWRNFFHAFVSSQTAGGSKTGCLSWLTSSSRSPPQSSPAHPSPEYQSLLPASASTAAASPAPRPRCRTA